MKLKRILAFALALLTPLTLAACGARQQPESAPESSASGGESETPQPPSEAKLRLLIDGAEQQIEWEDNDSVAALKALAQSAPLTVVTSRYGGFEQVGGLGSRLPKNDVRITTQPGDVVLYSGDKLVLFFGSNTWEYTRLGRISAGSAELEALLGAESATITITYGG